MTMAHLTNNKEQRISEKEVASRRRLKSCLQIFAAVSVFVLCVLFALLCLYCLGEDFAIIHISDKILVANKDGYQVLVKYKAEEDITIGGLMTSSKYARNAKAQIKKTIRDEGGFLISENMDKVKCQKMKNFASHIIDDDFCLNVCKRTHIVEIVPIKWKRRVK
jgi:hypothetical protein